MNTYALVCDAFTNRYKSNKQIKFLTNVFISMFKL
jgi:hypothetical protein